MDYVNLLLLVANLGLVIYALVRINALYVELRTPIVKKLSADLNLKPSSSRRPVGPQEMAARQGNNNRDQRNQQGNKDRQKDNRGERREQQPAAAAPVQAQQGEANRNREGRENRENRDGRDNRDRNRDNRGDRNRDNRGDRNRDNRGDRNRRPQEMMGNDAVAESSVTEGAEAVAVERTETRPSFEGRRPLEPRFAPEAPVANESVAAVESAAPAVEASEAPEFDPSKMRHGRRNMIKKSPAFEDETTGETTNV